MSCASAFWNIPEHCVRSHKRQKDSLLLTVYIINITSVINTSANDTQISIVIFIFSIMSNIPGLT